MSALGRKLGRDLVRQKAQFGAVTLTIFLGVALFGASYDAFRNLETSYERTFTEFRFANLTVSGGDVEAFAARAAETGGVASVEVRTVADLPFRVGPDKLLGRVVSLPSGSQPTVNKVRVLSGSYLDPAAPGAVLVEEHMADHFDLAPGDSFDILGPARWERAEVGGVISSPEYIWPARSRQEVLTSPDNFGVVFAGHSMAESLIPASPNEAAVYYEDGTEKPALTEELAGLAEELGASASLTREEQPSNAALREDLRGFQELSILFPILFLTAAAMATYVLLTRLVQAQRPYIGLMRAEGYSRRRVLRHYLAFGAVPGIVGAVLGVAAGLGLAFWITDLYTTVISVPVRIIEFRPATAVGGLGVGVVAAILAVVAPALSASRVPPAEAMRGGVPAGRGRPSLAERLVPPLRRLPTRWRMVLRGPGRNRRRTVYTMVGVILSLTLVLVSWGMLDTTQVLLDRQFTEIERQDAVVHLREPLQAERLAELEALDDVSAAEPALQLPVSIRGPDGSYESELLVLERDTSMHGFFLEDGRTSGLPAEGVLLGAALRDLLGLEMGDGARLVLGSGASVEEKVAGFLVEPMGTRAYVSMERAEELMGGDIPVTSALVRYRPGADTDAARRELTSVPSVAAVVDSRALFDTVQSLMGIFYAFVGVMLAFGAAMAFALIFASMSVNVAERSREMASLLADGAEGGRIARLITAENLLVTLAGVVPGLALGYAVSAAFMDSFSSDLFSFDLHMRPTTLAFSALGILVVALVSQWPGLRAVGRLNIAQVVRQRSV